MCPSPFDAELQRVIDGFLCGDSRQYRIIRVMIRQYVERHYSGSASEKDDLESEILRILLNALRMQRFNGNNLRSFNGFIYGIARIQVMAAVRRRSAGPERLTNPGLVPDQRSNNMETAAENHDLVEKIYSSLGSACARLLRMKFQKGWSDQEIADHEKKSKNAVSTAISRCIRKAQGLKIVKDILYETSDSEHLNK